MATIEINPDNVNSGVWWLTWVETGDILGRIVHAGEGQWRIAPSGPHWSPMKSFAAFTFETQDAALDEVRLYFSGR